MFLHPCEQLPKNENIEVSDVKPVPYVLGRHFTIYRYIQVGDIDVLYVYRAVGRYFILARPYKLIAPPIIFTTHGPYPFV